jgi:hypothetical protein
MYIQTHISIRDIFTCCFVPSFEKKGKKKPPIEGVFVSLRKILERRKEGTKRNDALGEFDRSPERACSG